MSLELTRIRGLPSPIGLRAHVELARISDYIVYNTYRVAAPRHMPDKSLSHAERAVQLLSDWRAKLPPQLQLPEDSFTNDRACYALHMNHNQVRLGSTWASLLYRLRFPEN